MIRGVILDIDGTLLASNAAHAWAFVATFAEHGYDIPFERILPLIGMGGDKVIPSLVPGLNTEEGEGKEISERHGEIFRERYLPDLGPTPGARALVEKLRDMGYRLAVATSSKGDMAEALLKAAQVDDLLGKITSSSDVDESKPAPDVVHAALQQLGLEPDEAIMLADTPFDVMSATKAGVAMIGFESGGWSREQLAGCVAVYADPARLLEHLDSSPLATAPTPV